MENLATIFKASSPPLRKIADILGLQPTYALLSIPLFEVVNFFNVGLQMDDVQVLKTARLIVQEFPYLKVEDLRLCFDKAMTNAKVYDRIDGNIILGWLREHAKIRKAEEERLRMHGELVMENHTRELNRWAINLLNNRDALNAVWNQTGMLNPVKALHIYTAFRCSNPQPTPPSISELCQTLRDSRDKSYQQRKFALFKAWTTGGTHYFVKNICDEDTPKGVDLLVPLPEDADYIWAPSARGGKWEKAELQAELDF